MRKEGGYIPPNHEAGFRGKIELKDVHFAYPTRAKDFVYKGVTLTIQGGQKDLRIGKDGPGDRESLLLASRELGPVTAAPGVQP